MTVSIVSRRVSQGSPLALPLADDCQDVNIFKCLCAVGGILNVWDAPLPSLSSSHLPDQRVFFGITGIFSMTHTRAPPEDQTDA